MSGAPDAPLPSSYLLDCPQLVDALPDELAALLDRTDLTDAEEAALDALLQQAKLEIRHARRAHEATIGELVPVEEPTLPEEDSP